MENKILHKYSIFEVKLHLVEMEKQYGKEAIKKFIGETRSAEIEREFKKEIALRLEPYWNDIERYEHGGFFTRLRIKIKYIFRDRRAECGVPKHVLEAIVDDMMPDIRAFFESEEGKREFEEWKKLRENASPNKENMQENTVNLSKTPDELNIKNESAVDSSKYVVLDVETNGLSSIRDDLLSISIYKPDSKEHYNRFLPLELNKEVKTTQYNGIKTEDLQGLLPLSQEEVDNIIETFELKKRTILIYGGRNFDENFITNYFKRHHLKGIDYFSFYNIKHEIISSSFSEGNITKDNLCNIYGIENVKSIHSGNNDCILEWKLFERMNGHKLLITNNKVFEFNNDYFVPASFITTYPNFKYYLSKLPIITCESRIVFSLPISSKKLKKFPTNFNGMIIEHLINSMLRVRKIDSRRELLENKKKLKYLGELPTKIEFIPMLFNPDGSFSATRIKDQELTNEINEVVKVMKELLKPLIDFIGNDIFEGESIKSQELVVYPDKKVLALCDLSNDNAVLEIKASTNASVQSYVDQLFYEANGRKCYVLLTEWNILSHNIIYTINEVIFNVKENLDQRKLQFEKAKERVETDCVELVSFVDIKSPVRLKCKNCCYEWNTSYNTAKKHRPCPNCSKKTLVKNNKAKRTVLTEEEKRALEEEKIAKKYLRFKNKLEERSEHKITALSFKDSRSPAKAKCLKCGYEWEARADHLLDRPYCPICRSR